MKKKHIILLIGLSIVIAACVYVASKDWQYGITMRVSDVLPTGLKIHIERDKQSSPRDLYDKGYTKLEKWTVFGWELLNKDAEEHSWLQRVPPGHSYEREMYWEPVYGKMPNGLYRITKSMEVEGDAQSAKTYHTPFIIVERWVKIVIVSFVILVICLSLLQYKVGIFGVCKRFFMKRKLLCIGILIATLFLAGGTWCLASHFWDEIIGLKYHYEIEVEEVTATGVTGKLKYNGDAREKRRLFIKLLESYSLEEKTPKGWKEIIELNKDDAWGTWVIREETTNDFTFTWEEEYGKLPKGTYRIVQPFFLMQKDKEAMKKGNMYITFEIEE